VLSAAAVARQFAAPDPEKREKTALRLIALSFFALAAVSLAVMPFLSLAERRAGHELGSATASADSKQTLICSSLSVALLVGLLLNVLFGWAWADSVAAFVIVVFAAREGLEAWRGDACKVPVSALTGERSVEHGDC
jgi:divalent metal cation (Fe/Co/Zn/Cd) transporter